MADEATDNTTATPPATSGGNDEIAELRALVAQVAEDQKRLGESVAGIAPLSADDVKKIVAEDAARRRVADEADAAARAKKAEARAKVIAARLAGVPEGLIHLPDSDDEAVLTAAAEKLAAQINALAKPGDQGGAAGEGGKTPAEQKPAAGAPLGGMSAGAAAFAAGLKAPAL